VLESIKECSWCDEPFSVDDIEHGKCPDCDKCVDCGSKLRDRTNRDGDDDTRCEPCAEDSLRLDRRVKNDALKERT